MQRGVQLLVGCTTGLAQNSTTIETNAFDDQQRALGRQIVEQWHSFGVDAQLVCRRELFANRAVQILCDFRPIFYDFFYRRRVFL